METRVDEIAERIYRLSTFLPQVGPRGFTFNQFLVDAEEPLLFHCGQRALFPAVSQAVARITDPRRLRWIAFSHIEADECGALAEWLEAAPAATVTHGAIGCAIWLNDQAPRPPRALADGEVLDLGGRRVRRLDTPHVPHCWDAGLIYEETTATLFTSDLFTHVGDPPALPMATSWARRWRPKAVPLHGRHPGHRRHHPPAGGASAPHPGRDARLIVRGRRGGGAGIAGGRLRRPVAERRGAGLRPTARGVDAAGRPC